MRRLLIGSMLCAFAAWSIGTSAADPVSGAANASKTDATGVDVTRVIVPPAESKVDARTVYWTQLLRDVLAVTKTEYGPAEVELYEHPMERDRVLDYLKRGIVHVYANATRPDFEESTLSIRFPIDKNVLGYRLLLINRDLQPLFAKIKTVDELKKLRLGTGEQWAITPIFEAAGFRLVPGSGYDSLFEMLRYGRFDYFPRGINEAAPELAARSSNWSKLAIEETLAISLPLPSFFFVSNKFPKLAERLEKGLRQMQASGAFDKAFYAYHKKMLDAANLRRRRIFRIDNPFLTQKSREAVAKYGIKL